jgi:hypothetical protein
MNMIFKDLLKILSAFLGIAFASMVSSASLDLAPGSLLPFAVIQGSYFTNQPCAVNASSTPLSYCLMNISVARVANGASSLNIAATLEVFAVNPSANAVLYPAAPPETKLFKCSPGDPSNPISDYRIAGSSIWTCSTAAAVQGKTLRFIFFEFYGGPPTAYTDGLDPAMFASLSAVSLNQLTVPMSLTKY